MGGGKEIYKGGKKKKIYIYTHGCFDDFFGSQWTVPLTRESIIHILSGQLSSKFLNSLWTKEYPPTGVSEYGGLFSAGGRKN